MKWEHGHSKFASVVDSVDLFAFSDICSCAQRKVRGRGGRALDKSKATAAERILRDWDILKNRPGDFSGSEESEEEEEGGDPRGFS